VTDLFRAYETDECNDRSRTRRWRLCHPLRCISCVALGVDFQCEHGRKPNERLYMDARTNVHPFRGLRGGIFPAGFAATCAIVGVLSLAAVRAEAADIEGKVQGANSPIAGSTVTLYAAGTGAPVQLAQGKTDDKGSFRLTVRKVS